MDLPLRRAAGASRERVRVRALERSPRTRSSREAPVGIEACAVEALEARALLSFGPAGPEFRVNTNPTNHSFPPAPAAAMDADGDFVVVWNGVGANLLTIRAQRYDAAGMRRGGEFSVDSPTPMGYVAFSP